MKVFLAGVVTGIVLATVGVSGVFKILDKGMETVKVQSKELSR